MDGITLPQLISRMDLDRLRAYQDNLNFYRGQQWLGTARRRERRLTFNYAKAFAEKVTSYVMGSMRVLAAAPDDSPEAVQRARRAERLLREVYEANDLAQLDFDTEMDAAVLGDGAFKVTWDLQARRVRVTSPDVQGLYVWWLGDDMASIWRVASRYALSYEEVMRLYGVRPPPRGSRGQAQVVESWTDDEFELWVDNHRIEARANPYGFIPFVIYPNLREPKEFWGVSDMPPIKESVRELNRAMSQLSMILELSGNPIAVLEGVSESEDIAVQPGAVWELPEKARAYLLDLLQGGGVRLHVDYIDLIYRTLHDLAETPRTAFGENRQGLSGVALQMEMDPLLKKVQRKRLIRAAAYRKRAEMILRIAEQHTGERLLPVRLHVSWGPVLPQDRSRQVEDEVKLVQAGVQSRRRAAAQLEVEEPESEFQRWLEEERQTGSEG